MTLLGVQRVNFTNDSGEVVDGYNVFYCCPEDHVYGQSAGKQFMSKSTGDPFFSKFKDLNDCIGVEFDFTMRQTKNGWKVNGIRGV